MKRRLFNILSAISLLFLTALVVLCVRGEPVRWTYHMSRMEEIDAEFWLGMTRLRPITGVAYRNWELMVQHVYPQYEHRRSFGVGSLNWNNPNQPGLISQWSCYVSAWVPIALLAVLPCAWVVLFRMRGRHLRRLQNHLCLRCGYDLRASEDRCPECGTPIPVGAAPADEEKPASRPA